MNNTKFKSSMAHSALRSRVALSSLAMSLALAGTSTSAFAQDEATASSDEERASEIVGKRCCQATAIHGMSSARR